MSQSHIIEIKRVDVFIILSLLYSTDMGKSESLSWSLILTEQLFISNIL